ncbi:hypothetical protein GQ457_03G026150 [Hibiscus cannabinus]
MQQNDDIMQQSSLFPQGQHEIIGSPQAAPFDSRQIYSSKSLSGKEILGGAPIVSSDLLLGSKSLGPREGYDIVMVSSEEDLPLANVESSKRPRFQPEDLGPLQFWHFRFEASWLLESSCEEEVERLWSSSVGTVPERLLMVSLGLDKWFRKLKREKKLSIRELQRRIDDLSNQLVSDEVLGDLVQSKLELNLELDKEEIYWEQRARANWLQNGDRNTRFFHQYANHRKRRNRIEGLVTDDGVFHDDMAEVKEIAVSYFSNLFTTVGVQDPSDILHGVPTSIDASMNQSLMRDFTSDEVFAALNSMSPLKASGADGLGAVFYQRFWGLIGSEIVSKMLANRLKLYLDGCIDEAQSAFVPGRLISDNVITAYEILHSYKKKKLGCMGSFALKVDMSKAYDRVEWGFLRQVMLKMGFCEDWVSLVMNCVSSPIYSVVVNGVLSDYFAPSRGLRQGDPISPYLFLICCEGLSSLFRMAAANGVFCTSRITRGAPLINHLLFADDCLIFGEATISNASQLKGLLDCYGDCSGQLINYEKSSIFFSEIEIEIEIESHKLSLTRFLLPSLPSSLPSDLFSLKKKKKKKFKFPYGEDARDPVGCSHC